VARFNEISAIEKYSILNVHFSSSSIYNYIRDNMDNSVYIEPVSINTPEHAIWLKVVCL